jgi:hypothetical protein
MVDMSQPPAHDRDDRMVYITAGFGPDELRIIHRVMADLGLNQSAAIRLLVRRGLRGPATSPFTPDERQP